MDWFKKKKMKKKEKKEEMIRGRERGARLLEDIIKCCDGKSNPIKFFSSDQIFKAIYNFSDSNRVIGLKGYLWSPWYSGKIDNHLMIFLREDDRDNYCRNIAISSMVSGHKSFLKLLGCCLEFEKPIIVYDFIKMSSLDIKMVVSWKRRIKIAEDIAIALAYLHTAFPRPFVYRLMALENIFLDEDGVARLWDFSCCVSIPKGETFVQVDGKGGLYDFMDVNLLLTGRVSEKTDVYAFGILMQKLLIGKNRHRELVIEETEKEDHDDIEIMSEMKVWKRIVPRWMSKSVEELADPKMLDEVGEEEFCQMKAFLMLSLRCTGCTNWEIPNMMEVAKELKNIQRSSFPSSSSSGESEIILGPAQVIFDSPQGISSSSSFASYGSEAGDTKTD